MVNVFPVAKRFVGVGKETTSGTAVAATTTIPVNKFDPEDKPMFLVDDSWRGAMAGEYGLIQGPEIAELEIGGPIYADAIGHALFNILGDYAVTGTGPYTHTFALLNSGSGQPPTHTFVDYTGIPATGLARQYAYACLSEVTITGNAEQLLTWDAKATTFVSSIPGSAPTANISTVPAQGAWNSAVTIGGSAATDVAEWELTLTRKVDPYWTAQGSQDPLVIARGELTVAGKLTFAPAVDESPLLAMLNNTQPELQIVATGSGGTTLTLHCQIAAYDTSKINSGKSLFGYDVTFKGIANTTDVGASAGYSPVLATLVNSVTTY